MWIYSLSVNYLIGEKMFVIPSFCVAKQVKFVIVPRSFTDTTNSFFLSTKHEIVGVTSLMQNYSLDLYITLIMIYSIVPYVSYFSLKAMSCLKSNWFVANFNDLQA